jgi:hypothetical protein
MAAAFQVVVGVFLGGRVGFWVVAAEAVGGRVLLPRDEDRLQKIVGGESGGGLQHARIVAFGEDDTLFRPQVLKADFDPAKEVSGWGAQVHDLLL